MSKEERVNYLNGLVDMKAFQAEQSGNAAAPKCIYDAYYRDKDQALWNALIANLNKFPDKQPAAIVFLLTQKMCGG